LAIVLEVIEDDERDWTDACVIGCILVEFSNPGRLSAVTKIPKMKL
jgi:hypothetical protein